MENIIEFIEVISEGGAETLVKTYALELKRDGYNPIIIVYRKNPNSSNEKIILENEVQIEAIFSRWNFFTRIANKLFHEFIIKMFFKKIIKKYNPIAIHCHAALLSDLKLITKQLNGINIFYTCHSLPERYFDKNRIKEFSAAKFLIEHNNLQMIALHHGMKTELDRMFTIDNTVVVRNGIDFDRFLNCNIDREDLRSKLHISIDAFVIGHIGRFIYIKNQLFLIEVFCEILKYKENAILLLIGDGEDELIIRQKIQKHNITNKVIILSHRSDIPELLSIMDIFVFPSLFEGLPVTLIEAQVSGLRCVISDTINCESIISNTTIPMKLSDGPAQWAFEILNDSKRTQSTICKNEYNIKNVMKKMEKMYVR